MDRVLIRADSYVIRRQVFNAELVDTDLPPVNGRPAPFRMSGSSIRMTFKVQKTDPVADPTDMDAPIKADIAFDENGDVVSSRLLSLPSGMTADDGMLQLTMTKEQTLALPLNVQLLGDMQVTDENSEDITIPVLWTVQAEDGYTNRTSEV